MNALKFAIFFIASLFHLTRAWAQLHSNSELDPGNLGAQLSVLAQQRAELLAQRDRDDGACLDRFAVNDCRAAVRERYRAPLADLDRQELLLKDQDRRARAAVRLQALEDKAVRIHDSGEGSRPALLDPEAFEPTSSDLRAPLVPEIRELPRAEGGSSGGVVDIGMPSLTKPAGDLPAARASALQERRERAQNQVNKRKGQALPTPASEVRPQGAQP